MTIALGPSRRPVEDLAELLEEMAARAEAEPWRWVPWLPLQLRYLRSQARYRCLRGPNQAIGKSTVALADLLAHALGEHPHRQAGRDKAGEYWIVCRSWSQSVNIQGKLHALIPPARLHPDAEFTEIRGFRGKNPAVEVRHRLGGYSVIRFKTTQQGAANMAGASIEGALFDEPPASEAVYSEVAKRVLATGGWVSLAMTPIGAPVEWIRKRVEEGLFEDIHSRLTPDQLIPVGHSRPRCDEAGNPMDGAWIDRLIRETPSHEVPVRVHGEWEMRVMDRYFTVFRSGGADSHVTEEAPKGDVDLWLGLDHGDRPGKQIAVLIAVKAVKGAHPQVYVIDHYTDETGTATPDDDAAGILSMLARYGWKWHDLQGAGGDRVHLPGAARQKSNKDLMVALGRRLGTPWRALQPQIRTVKRGTGRGRQSVEVGARWLYNAMSRPGGFGIHPRCQRLITALDTWDFRDDDNKDPIDALRYGLDRFIFGGQRGQVRQIQTR